LSGECRYRSAGKFAANFLQQRIYPGRITEKNIRHEWVISRNYALNACSDTVFFDMGANIGLNMSAVAHQMRLSGGELFPLSPSQRCMGC